jgi:hypothetical protein
LCQILRQEFLEYILFSQNKYLSFFFKFRPENCFNKIIAGRGGPLSVSVRQSKERHLAGAAGGRRDQARNGGVLQHGPGVEFVNLPFRPKSLKTVILAAVDFSYILFLVLVKYISAEFSIEILRKVIFRRKKIYET